MYTLISEEEIAILVEGAEQNPQNEDVMKVINTLQKFVDLRNTTGHFRSGGET